MIRPAHKQDFGVVSKIRTALTLKVERIRDASYKLTAQSSGFLLFEQADLEDFEQDLEKYFVAEQDGEVVGFAFVDGEPEMPLGREFYWLKPEMEAVYWATPHAGLGCIGVLSGAGRKGVATLLLQAALEKAQVAGAPYLFSFVMLSPITNFPSMMFHEKHGFERIAIQKPLRCFGMDHYQCILYGKRIST